MYRPGRKLKQTSVDAGARWMLTDAIGQPLQSWDSRGHALRSTYDELRRPLELFITKDMDPEVLAERTVWGEGHIDAATKNLRGQPYQRYDGAGVVTSETYDFKGNLLASARRLRSAYATPVDWPFLGLTDLDDIIDAAGPLLELETFESSTAYDALNRPTSLTTPDASELRPTYNEAGLLEAVDVRLRGGATWTGAVDDIDYDAKGQRERIVYANGTRTAYTYDPLTFRLARLKTIRGSDSAVLQDLLYTYDPIGNILAIEDAAQQTVFFDNAVVTSSALYEYDPLYRLTEATGREHAGGLGDNQRDQNNLPMNSLPHANDAQALRNYTEGYAYDKVGNILQMIHDAGGPVGSWTRGYRIADASNRLEATSLQGDDLEDPESYSAEYTHDAHGNMVAMPHLAEMAWDFKDQMIYADKGGGGDVYFTYDAAGQRVRKVWEHAGLIEERIYLGGWELYRRRIASSGVLELERETLHLMDGEQRVAMLETKTVDTSDPALVVTPRFRYQLGNHLGSALLEVDETGSVIYYEEYHPYGTTAYRSGRSGVEVSAKRYRYTGKERDDETGLYYHGARYYACWLGRWTAADPAGMVDGANLYAYVRGSPVRYRDPTGHLTWLEDVLDDIVNPTNPVARAIMRNLNKRGEALVNAPGAIKEVVEKEGLAGLGKAVASGAGHLVKDTGEALGDIAWEATHYEGDKSAEKIASRSLDVVLNTADAMSLAAGGAGAAKGGAQAAASVDRTIRGAAAAVKTGTPALAVVGGGVAAGTAVAGEAAVAGGKAGASGLKTVGGATTALSTGGKGVGGGKPKPTEGATVAKGPVHHVMTNKNRVSTASGGPWTPRFEDMAKRAGMTLEDAANKVAVPGHRGPHPQAYHEAVFDRLRTATRSLEGDAYSSAFKAELNAIRTEAATAGSALNKLLLP